MFWDGVKHARPKIDVLINTHHHGDHTAGNKVLGPNASVVVAHAKVPGLQRAAAEQAKTLADQVFATTLTADAWNTSLKNDLKVSTKHYGPAHTGGDIVVTFEQPNVVHMGDLVFNRAHPFIDRPAGASIANWITVCEAVTKDHAADTLYIFGHGKDGAVVGKREDLLLERDYLTALLETARKAVAAGQSKEELLKMTALAGVPGTRGDERHVRAVPAARRGLRRGRRQVGPSSSRRPARSRRAGTLGPRCRLRRTACSRRASS